ncbi:hypothetical protein WICMUC_000884 [Wickerhamomyces mucosus]|uniref:FAD-binding FR-type domain-containing protein n=1 Tax=Wickerhamomyces mucosus TaxID=1378264 RepID=A0A9P8TIF3_9ASCO|nr:hypothetical protein WICMUC_000884 [Wickerhamomyces mucosus]
MPLNFWLSLKIPSTSFLSTDQYLGKVWLHKWISRFIVLASTLHSIGFLGKWIKEGTLQNAFAFKNFLGLVTFVGFFFSVFISLKPIRRKFYSWFYSIHLAIGYLSLILLEIHSRPGITLFTLINVGVVIYSVVLKFLYTYETEINVLSQDESLLQLIKISAPFDDTINQGCHIRIGLFQKLNPLHYLTTSHPYTLIQTQTNEMVLIVKKTNFEFIKEQKYTIFGPFNSSIPPDFDHNVKNLLLVSGGSGLSFNLPNYLKYFRNKSINLKLIWIVRNIKDLWILKEFGIDYNETIHSKKIEIFITQSQTGLLEDDETEVGLMNDIEMPTIEPDLTKSRVNFQRPNLYRIVSDFFNNNPNSTSTSDYLIGCGPERLNNELQFLGEQNQVKVISELYEM